MRTVPTAILALLIAIILPSVLPAQHEWSLVDRLPESADLRAVDIVHKTLMVAVGEGGAIKRSVDGGRTWAVIESPIRADFRGVSFVHPVAGVAVGVGGRIVRTIDAGVTWSHRPSGTSADLNGVASVKDTMVAVGAGGTMIRSLDWSASWVPLPTITNSDLHAIRFFGGESESGIAVGDGGVVLRTDDAGATWRVIREGSEALRAIDLLDPLRWYAVGAGGETIVTTDGGETWQQRPVVADYSFAGVDMVDGDFGWSVGTIQRQHVDDPEVRFTLDGGATWSVFVSGVFGLDGGLEIDSGKVVLVGRHGVIWFKEPIDTSNSFSAGSNPSGTRYREMTLDDGNDGYVVGFYIDAIENGDRIVRRERSDHRTAIDSVIFPDMLNAVDRVGASGAWMAVGENGVVLRRTEDDPIWRAIELSPTTDFVDVTFRNHRIGAIAGRTSLIYLTDDGGLGWDSVSAPAEEIRQLFWWDDTTLAAYSFSENALFSYSLVSRSWSAARPVGTVPIDRFDPIDRESAFGFSYYMTPATGTREHDLVVRTTDRGMTWETLYDTAFYDPVSGTMSNGLVDGDFWDRNNGVAVGPNRTFLATHDGGETWSRIVIPYEIANPLSTPFDVVMTGPNSGMFIVDEGHYSITGEGDRIVRFTLEVSSVDDGSDDFENLDLTAYPNPTRGGTIRVRWEGGVLAGGLIATADGRIIGRVDAAKGAEGDIEVTMPELPSGVYHLLLQSEEGTREVPIIVTR